MACSDVSEYPRLSTVGVANFVSVKPCVEGDGRSTFKIWKKQMLCLLESQEVAGYVDGGIPPPPEDEEKKKIMWRRTDMLVQGWILGSIGDDALDVVWDKPTAREIWLELDNIFEEEEDKSNAPWLETKWEEDFSGYSALHEAAKRGDWNTAKNFFQDINQLGTTIISANSETTLHIAVMTGKSNGEFVKKLVELMPPEALALKDSEGYTALHNAAFVGNTEAAKAIVKKFPDSLYISNNIDWLPVLVAAFTNQKETLEYLLSEHKVYAADRPIFEGQTGIKMLNGIIC